MSVHQDREIEIWLRDRKITTIPQSTLSTFDRLAQRNPSWEYRSLPAKTHEEAAKHVIAWMCSQAPLPVTSITPLRPLSDNISQTTEPDFVTTIQLYSAMIPFGLHTNHSLAGREVRDALFAYVRMAPLTFEEFVLLIDLAGRDVALVNETLRVLKAFRRQGNVKRYKGVPEWKRIVGFCEKRGIELSYDL